MEYLVTMTTHVPDGTPAEAVDDVRTREALGRSGHRAAAQAERPEEPGQSPAATCG